MLVVLNKNKKKYLDASPWGIGGYIIIRGIILHWFASAISEDEANILSFRIGDAAGQQAAEALAALVALRTWHGLWKEQTLLLRVRSDSISALVMTIKLKTSGKGCIVVAREMALDIARACYEPVAVEHVPGVANKICDGLSRRYQPGKSFSVPPLLADVPETKLPPRGQEYFRSISLPPGAQVRS